MRCSTRSALAAPAARYSLQIRLPAVAVNRRAASARHDVVHAVGGPVRPVSLHPVVEQVIVPGDRHAHMVAAKQRLVQIPHRERRRLDDRASVRSGREHGVMKHSDHVLEPCTVQMLELIADPGQLFGVGRDVRVEHDDEHVCRSRTYTSDIRSTAAATLWEESASTSPRARCAGRASGQDRRAASRSHRDCRRRKKNGRPAVRVIRSTIGVKLTFHAAASRPAVTASPDWTTKRTGNGVDASDLIFSSIASTTRPCPAWSSTPSAWPRESPYARNENRVTPADSASAGSGRSGGSIGRTRDDGRDGRRRLLRRRGHSDMRGGLRGHRSVGFPFADVSISDLKNVEKLDSCSFEVDSFEVAVLTSTLLTSNGTHPPRPALRGSHARADARRRDCRDHHARARDRSDDDDVQRRRMRRCSGRRPSPNPIGW